MATTGLGINEAMQHDSETHLADVMAAHNDLSQRVVETGFNVWYDHAIDDLLLTIGSSVEAATIPIGDWLYVRYEPDTLKIVGFGVLGLRTAMKDSRSFAIMYEQAIRDPGEAVETFRKLVKAA